MCWRASTMFIIFKWAEVAIEVRVEGIHMVGDDKVAKGQNRRGGQRDSVVLGMLGSEKEGGWDEWGYLWAEDLES